MTDQGAVKPHPPPGDDASSSYAETNRGERGLSRRAAVGVLWVGFTTAGARVLGAATTIVLARLLAPRDFGVVAVASIVITALALFSDLGVGPALVQHPGQRDAVASTCSFLTPAFGLALFLAAFSTAPLSARWLGDPSAVGVIRVLSVSLVINSLGIVPSMLLEKDLRFRRKSIPDGVPIVVFAAFAVTLASLGMGAYSLAYGQIAQACTGVMLSWLLCGWRPKRRFDTRIARDLLGYGKHVLGGSIIIYLTTTLDNGFVSKEAGAGALGAYVLAYTIANLPATDVADVAGRVLFPSFVEINRQPDRLRKAYLRSVALLAVATFPMLAGMAGLAGPITVLVLGPRWHGVREPLMILTLFSAFRVLAGVTGNLLLAMGRPRIILLTGLSGLVIQITLLWLFVVRLGWGATGASWAVSGAAAINGVVILVFVHSLVQIALPTLVVEGLRIAGPALLSFGVFRLGAVVLPTTIPSLVLTSVAGALCYVGAVVASGGSRRLKELWRAVSAPAAAAV